MAIVQNTLCPECSKTGHDRSSNHLLHFSDGNKLCTHSSFHLSGSDYFEGAEEGFDISKLPINGTIRYTEEQFTELVLSGSLSDDMTRSLALSGMRNEDAYKVMNTAEKSVKEASWADDVEYYKNLKCGNLVARGLKAEFLNFYGIKTGRDSPTPSQRDAGKKGSINRCYTPRYEDGVLCGAKCRFLPKVFTVGHLGKLFGNQDLFGMETISDVLRSGQTMNTLVVVGGELDAVSVQQMLVESAVGTKYANRKYHVWSVNKGEMALSEILHNKKHINKYRKVIWCFDNDEVGQKLARECSRLLPNKSYILIYPSGVKDPNDCILRGKEKEFVDSWFNPSDISSFMDNAIKSISSIATELKKAIPKRGLSWPWPSLDKITLGIRKHILFAIGAGSGVGKTEFCRAVTYHLIEEHGESVAIISTEDPFKKNALAYIGKWMNKRIELPSTTDKEHEDYREITDFTEAEVNKTIDYVASTGKLFVTDLEGDCSIDRIIEVCEDYHAMGVDNIIIDNLTGVTVPQGKNKVEFLDSAVKKLGNLKDSKPMTIFLVSHLTRVQGQRIPHERGGEVELSDYRGSSAIGQWCSYAIAIRRDTKGATLKEKTTTIIECVKDRDQGLFTGESVELRGNINTGVLKEVKGRGWDATEDIDNTISEDDIQIDEEI